MFEEPELLPLAGAWDRALLGPVADINERTLECLRRAALASNVMSFAAADAAGCSGLTADTARPRGLAAHAGAAGLTASAALRAPALLSPLAPLWRALDAVALRRLATCPYLLIDVGFGQAERWERLLPCAVRDAPGAAYFQGPEGVALVRRSLLLAWHLARSNRLGARVLLGMSPGAAERIAESRLQDLDTLAERGCPWAAPRWERRPRVWQQLLAAAAGPQARLRQAQLHGLQLLAAEREAAGCEAAGA